MKACGPHRSPEKQFPSVNTFMLSYDYTITLMNERKHYLLWRFECSIFVKNWVPLFHSRMLCAEVWLKLAHWSWRSRVLNFVNVFSLLFPLGKGSGPLLKKLEFSLPKDALCEVWLKLAKWFWRRSVLNFLNVFSLFPLGKGRSPSFEQNFNPFHPRMLCVKFGWNWPNGSRKEDFKISSMFFRYFVIISPWQRTWTFIWTKFYVLRRRML